MTTTFIVIKHDCASCAMVIEGICEDTPGVTKAEVNGLKKILTVEHGPDLDLAGLQKALLDEGYPVER